MWKFIGKVLQFLAAGYLVLVAGFLLFLMTMCDAGWHHSQDVFVRNQTSAPLLLTFTIPRSTLALDTVWWGVAGKNWGIERQVGYVVRLTALTAEGFRYPAPVSLPVLVTTTADTLESIDTRTDLGRGYVTRLWDREPWLTRQRQASPAADDFARGRGLTVRMASRDSVQLTFSLAPDSSFLVARRSLRLHHSDPDRIESEEFVLRPTVHWVNAAGSHSDDVPAAALRQLEVAAQQERSNNYQLTHYLDYR